MSSKHSQAAYLKHRHKVMWRNCLVGKMHASRMVVWVQGNVYWLVREAAVLQENNMVTHVSHPIPSGIAPWSRSVMK